MFKRTFLMMLVFLISVSSAFAEEPAENSTEVNETVTVSDEVSVQVVPTDYKEEGVASWYGEEFQGKVTASGEPYDMDKLTAAHNYLPLGVKVTVTNLDSGKTADVTINDRGPFVPDRIIDLSRAAADKLGFTDVGKANVRIEPYRPEEKKEVVAKPAEHILYGSFYIQVGAYKVKDNADRLIERLEKAGFHNTRIVRVVTDSAQIFKVQLGMYKSLANARKANLKIGPGFPGTFILADVIQY